MLVDALREMLPQLREFAVARRWGGALGILRDFTSAVSIDETTDIAGVESYTGKSPWEGNADVGQSNRFK